MESLKKRFEAAGLRCELVKEPLQPHQPDIFQMDIAVKRGRQETFRVWPGAQSNRVEALGIDKKLEQLVLFVQEPKRPFRQSFYAPGSHARARRRQEIERLGGRVVEVTKRHVVAELFTQDQRRHMLCGMDESHLFVAQLPKGCSTVRSAHKALAPNELASQSEFTRQGEWFFVPVSEAEAKAVQRGVVQRKLPIGVGGNPHVVDELVRLRGEAPNYTLKIYIRGRVRHVDHKTLKFHHWMRVYRNAEPQSALQRLGIDWID